MNKVGNQESICNHPKFCNLQQTKRMKNTLKWRKTRAIMKFKILYLLPHDLTKIAHICCQYFIQSSIHLFIHSHVKGTASQLIELICE